MRAYRDAFRTTAQANGGCNLQNMPRNRPSPATLEMAEELSRRGLPVSCRAVEDWAARGLAPGPVRHSLGRGRGTASGYPPGAADHYAAVAAVMRRGRPWQVSVLKLVSHGHLPAEHGLVRRAFEDLLSMPPAAVGQDALDYAEQIAAGAERSPVGRSFLRAFERNLRQSAQILEPGTPLRPVALGVLATLTLAALGEPSWSEEAIVEMIAAYGVCVGDMTDDERAGLARFADAFFTQVTGRSSLLDTASQGSLPRILAAIPEARATVEEVFASSRGFPAPPEDIADVLTALAALVLVRIEDFGGGDAVAQLATQALQQDHAAA